MNFFSLATQKKFSYQVEFNSDNVTGDFEFGFTGESGRKLSFSGISGRLYDNEGNFFYSYRPNVPVSISGNVLENYHNYFVRGKPLNLKAPASIFSVEDFYYSDGPSFNLSIQGEIPSFQITNPVFEQGNTTGEFTVYNLDSGVKTFRFFSGQMISNQDLSFLPFDSGKIETSKDFQIVSNNPIDSVFDLDLDVRFFTNFGVFETSLNTPSNFPLITHLSLNAPANLINLTTGNGNLSYFVMRGAEIRQQEITPLTISLEIASGSGSVADYNFFTGLNTGNLVNFNANNYHNGVNIFQGPPIGVSGQGTAVFRIVKLNTGVNDWLTLTVLGEGSGLSRQIRTSI